MSSALRNNILKYLKLFVAVIICSYVLLRGIAAYQYQPMTFDGDYFSFSDKKVRYKCSGNGEQVVFFESGFGADSEESWEPIINALPEHVTACYYDRLGHGGSDDVPTDFTTDQKSQLQESLIKHIAGERPVILVAKSYGGIISRRTLGRTNLLEPAHASTPHSGQFQSEQSQNLDSDQSNINFLAVIFLDSAHENQHTILRGKFEPISDFVKNAQYVNAALGLTSIKNIFKDYDSILSKRLDQYYSSFQWAHVLSTYRNEKGFYTSLEDFNYDFGNLPLYVLSHDKEAYAGNPRFYSMTEEWAKMQKEIAGLSKNTKHIVVKGATHDISGDAPEVVIETISSLVL